MTVQKLTDKYITIHVASAENFDTETLRTLWVDKEKGIQEIIGKSIDSNNNEAHAFVFDKDSWMAEDAREWVRDIKKNKKVTCAELFAKKRLFVTANLTLCDSKPSLVTGTKNVKPLIPEEYEKNLSQANLNDKYFFYVEGVHEGMNGNFDVFTKEELVKSYKSAGFQLVDWEQIRDEVIGFSLESELITHPDTEPIAVAFTGILNRLSPFMQVEERIDDIMVSRDELVRQRFFEDKLAVSMECLFDSARCAECGFETDDALEFDFHRWIEHSEMIENGEIPGRELIGVDFVGWGIVETPADYEAYTTSLRTSDDGTIQPDIIEANDKTKYGSLASNVTFAKLVARTEPFDTLLSDEKIVFASESKKIDKKVKKDDKNAKKVDVSPTKQTKNPDNNVDKNLQTTSDLDDLNQLDNSLDLNDTNDVDNLDNTDNKNLSNKKNNKGGNTMLFNLASKITEEMTLADIFVMAQTTLRDFQGDNPLEAEAAEAFATELAEVIKAAISVEDFKVGSINRISDEEKLASIELARKEEQKIAQDALTLSEAKYVSLVHEKEEVEATLLVANSELDDLKNEEVKKETEAKVNAFIEDVKGSGAAFSEDFEVVVRDLAKASVNDDEGLEKLKISLLASIKQSVLIEASKNSGASAGSDDEPSTMTAKLEALKKDN